MLGPVDLSKYFYRNTRIIGMQTSGLTHADSLAQTPYNVNCLNWTVGHILLNRSNTMRELGQDSSFGELARYARESDPIVEDGPGVVPLPELLQRLDESQKTLREVFDTVSDQVWAAPDDEDRKSVV